jgi:magnesium-protoporphyrin O-methyltransferase
MSASGTYDAYRGRLETYFDRTALKAWEQLTSDAPVSRIRATVRAGRDRMRDTLLGWLPADLTGRTVLDAGCGTGALAIEAARRGAHVVAVDVSGGLIDIARDRCPAELSGGSIDFRVGDMLNPAFGRFDHVVAMDSLIHYPIGDIVRVVESLAARTDRSIQFTFAPRTPALSIMHAAGKLFPRSDRAPAIIPAAETLLRRRLATAPGLRAWTLGRSSRVSGGFYTSQAQELMLA